MRNAMKLHEAIIQYRIVYIAVIIFFMTMTWRTIHWFEFNHSELTEAAAAGFISIVLSLVGALKYALENISNDKSFDKNI
ncbi:MAG: hypothetical protein GY820_38220 [Gammaproteobacteria bacterium]|nr:hypothetical protein [Gammaproteobacteria bacterium]